MWPKTFLQLLELAPHVTRLVPVADRYFQSRAEVRDRQRRELEQMRGEMGQVADGMRGDLAQLAAAQAGVYHQLSEQSETLNKISADVRTIRVSCDEMESRLAEMEKRISRLWITFLVALVVFVIFAAGVVAVFTVLHISQYFHGF
jgi:septal ring factor EnvC (AmiA/AmiB activator)